MDEVKLKQCADFLSIALETFESGNEDVALEFIEDVIPDVSESHANDLREAKKHIESGNTSVGESLVGDVYSDLVDEISAM